MANRPQRPLLEQEHIRTLAVFRALQLGDMLCAVPALRALRNALPAARITLIGLPWAEQFAARFPRYIDDFIAFPGHPDFPEQVVQEARLPAFYATMRERQFDCALQLHGSGNISNGIVQNFGARITAGFITADAPRIDGHFLDYPAEGPEPLRLLRLTEFLGVPPAGAHLEFPLDTRDFAELAASGVGADLLPGSYFCVHPGARSRDKCWPPHLFAQVADFLAEESGLRVVLTGSAKETDLTAEVAKHMQHPAHDAAGPLSIGGMAALMSGARLLLCNDTGVSHIAAALRLPSVVVFSKADIRRWSPLDRARHRCLWDPQGDRADDTLRHARELLQAAVPLSA
jgi:ADP-heptose:LPS heptosyltransferase